MHKNKGFTLVELAIVLTIIGLLIAGILKAQQLVVNSRASSFITQYKAIQAAQITFNDIYSALPGDMPNATDRVPGCTFVAAPGATDCWNGNADGIIGRDTSPIIFDQTDIAALPEIETKMFWVHLQQAELISGLVRIGSDTTVPGIGVTHPATPLGGSFLIAFYDGVPGNNPDMDTSGHIIAATGAIISTEDHTSPSAPIMSTVTARYIDSKLDDGTPNTGFVRAGTAASNCYGAEGDPAAKYLTNDPSNLNCHLYIQLQLN